MTVNDPFRHYDPGLDGLLSVAALRAGEFPGRQRQSGKACVPSQEGAATTSAHGDAGPDLYGFPDQVSVFNHFTWQAH